MPKSQQYCMGPVPVSSDKVEFEGRQMKQFWIQYIEEIEIQKIPLIWIRIHCIRIKTRPVWWVAIRMPTWILFRPTLYCRSKGDVRVLLVGVCLFYRWPTRKLEQDFLRCVRDKLPGDGFPKTETLPARNQAFLVHLGGGGGGGTITGKKTGFGVGFLSLKFFF